MRTLAIRSKLAAGFVSALVVAGALLPPEAAPAKDRAKGGRGGVAQRLARLEARLGELEAELAERPRDVSSYRLPDRVELCGHRIDLDDPDVRERLEHAFYLMVADRAQVVLWIKRARRVFPVIDAEVKKQGVCPDLRYLAIIESGLRPAVTSSASAHGWWQFMAATGRAYGLDIDEVWDQRADLEASTRAGVGYLRDLHARFGDWLLAFAAYNTGPTRLDRSIEAQGTRDYWRLDLFTEAERYVPRIAAAKIIFENLERYDFRIGIEDGYAPVRPGYVKIDLPAGRSVAVLDAARKSGIPVRTLKRLNPELQADVLPTGRPVVIEVPRGREPQFREAVAALAREAVAKRPTRSKRASRRASRRRVRHYTVRAGDSLWDIAQATDASVEDLRRWNGLGNRDVIHPGQKIIVRR